MASAALVCSPALAIESALESGLGEPTPKSMSRQVDVFSHDSVAVGTFYRQRVEENPAGDQWSRQGLWGLQARSAVPLVDARAQIDYSEYLPAAGHGFTGQDQAGTDNRLLRVHLHNSHRYLDYRMSFFSVGRAYLNEPLARERLDAMGLPGAGEGAVLQATGTIPRIAITPTFRRVDISEDLAGGNADRQSSLVTLGLSTEIPTGSVFLRQSRFELAHGRQTSQSSSRWEAGGSLAPFGEGLRLSPVIAREEQWNEAAEALNSRLLGLNIHTALPGAAAIDLNLQHKTHRTQRQDEYARTLADLAFSTPLGFREQATLSASVGYRGVQGRAPAPEEGMSVRLSIDVVPGR